ncbi:hypothetical protein L198_06729 [Cryptococcus wingfieldii CBS 7118]|uniref:Uncharacterized protein n=1 Tax=Cryptococcus wingfieldii CBS 7118 TaxID=1295528 RepID=A0A1E3IIM1_9TREE|nr:hypothetical protein L198_06729 [Cryptococcus wingfieldii CBS 7118]ODN88457.1 hypothetical protein L198_06729 [Cryptococcus wingfieldii CBS 7118]
MADQQEDGRTITKEGNKATLPTSSNISHLPFPSEIISLIYDFYVDSPLLGTRDFTTPPRKNAGSFFLPWIEWYDDVFQAYEDDEDEPPSSDADVVLSPIQHYLPSSLGVVWSLMFVDATALLVSLDFYKHIRLSRGRIEGPGTPYGSFIGPNSLTFGKSALRFKPGDREVWSLFRRSNSHLLFHTYMVCLHLPAEGVHSVVAQSLKRFLDICGDQFEFRLNVHNCTSPTDILWHPRGGHNSSVTTFYMRKWVAPGEGQCDEDERGKRFETFRACQHDDFIDYCSGEFGRIDDEGEEEEWPQIVVWNSILDKFTLTFDIAARNDWDFECLGEIAEHLRTRGKGKGKGKGKENIAEGACACGAIVSLIVDDSGDNES